MECTPETTFSKKEIVSPFKNCDDLDKLEELASLQSQEKELRLQDKLGKQNFHEKLKNFFYELLIQSIRQLKKRLSLLKIQPKQLN